MTLAEALKINQEVNHPVLADGPYRLSEIGASILSKSRGPVNIPVFIIIDDKWYPDPKACDHNPYRPIDQIYQADSKGYINPNDVQKMIDVYRSPKCKCGAYLKPTGWEKI